MYVSDYFYFTTAEMTHVKLMMVVTSQGKEKSRIGAEYHMKGFGGFWKCSDFDLSVIHGCLYNKYQPRVKTTLCMIKVKNKYLSTYQNILASSNKIYVMQVI